MQADYAWPLAFMIAKKNGCSSKLFSVRWQIFQNTTFGLLEKMMAQPQKMSCKIPMNTRATIFVMLLG